MNTAQTLASFGLTPENSIVIGSGILGALNIRSARDTEVVVSADLYEFFLANTDFQKQERQGRPVFVAGSLEILFSWTIVGTVWTFQDLCTDSVIIDGVRYTTVEFLCNAKTAWLLNGEFRQKDKDDVILMNAYLDKHSHTGRCCS